MTSRSSFSIDDTRLGTFGGASFTSSTTVGGASTVRARVGTMSVSTPITVRLDQKVSDTPPAGSTSTTPVPADPGSKFGGTVDTSYKPQIVYPNNGVLVPPNLGQLEIHFLPNNASTSLFELAFSNSITNVRVYMRCYLPSGFTLPSGVSRGCIYTPEDKVWKFLAESNRGGQPVKVTVRSTDDSGSGTVGVSDPIAIQFARAEIKGALYYWTTSGGTGVMRYDFAGGTGTQTASPVLRASNISTSVSCVGCHALSRNGKKLVAEVNGQNDGRLALVDLSTFKSTDKIPLSQGGVKLSNFESWNPDGTKFVGVYADSGTSRYSLQIFNGDTAAFESEIPNSGDSTNPANHPDWSPDGQTIAYMSMSNIGSRTNQRSWMGTIKMVTAKTGGGWNAPVTVVAPETYKNRYYPAIAPDNSFLVYNESLCVTADTDKNCNGDTDPSARLWAAKLQAGAQRVELAKANEGGVMDKGETKLTNSYPKWSPFVTRGNSGDTSRLMWVTFSSSRKYGLRVPITTGGDENPSGTLLWMAAVDPDKVSAGVDPSYASFALPFQDLSTSNHIAQWAQYLVSNGCSTVGEGCNSSGSTCCNGLQCVQTSYDPPIPCDVAGACVCQAIPQCAPSFEKCSSVAPCCDGLSCVDDSTGGACSGPNCTCKPPCSNVNQPCGGASACCDGLRCTDTSSGSVCRIIIE
ncbi:hypothetical protein DAT35_17570 [Vitiosangium sp. GDMCC 1.1324]|nr:hypothetical protein DAT35_17570 [Vitiosangium sp. GDMCC 1.1324]